MRPKRHRNHRGRRSLHLHWADAMEEAVNMEVETPLSSSSLDTSDCCEVGDCLFEIRCQYAPPSTDLYEELFPPPPRFNLTTIRFTLVTWSSLHLTLVVRRWRSNCPVTNILGNCIKKTCPCDYHQNATITGTALKGTRSNP